MKNQLLNALRVVLMLLIPTLTFAQAPPLGTAADFVLFTSVGAVTNVGTYKYLTHLTGNVGTNSGSSTNFGNVNGVMHDGDGASGTCASDVLLAYNTLGAAIPDSTLGSVIGNGTTLKAHTYLMPGATSLNLGLTLDAQGNSNAVFIFKTPTAVAYAFTANPNSKIHLINGAQACNVFWQVSGAVDLGAGTTFRGTIIAHGAISMAAQDTLEGRALTVNGAITVSNGAIGLLAYTPIGCGTPVLIGPAAPTFVASGSYAVFATTGAASDCGTSRIIGDVGGNTVPPTGFNPDSVTGGIHFNDPSTNAAAADLLLVFNYLLGLPYDIKLLDPAEFGHNLVLTPHTYQMDAAVTLTDTLYLNALGNTNAVFVIKSFGAFATTVGSKIILINGTQSKNVYWFCSAAVSITANSIFKGAIIAHDAIEMLPGSKLDGRVFSTNGALTTCGITASLPSPISAGPDSQTACSGSSVSLSITASGTSLTYQWRKGTVNLIDAGNISGANSATLTFNPVNISDAALNYNVTVVGPSTPAFTSNNASITVNPLPAAVAGVDRAICLNASTTLGAASVTGSTYSWTSVPAGFISTLSNPLVTPLVTTTYTVVESVTATGCTNTHGVLVTVNPLPAAVAGVDRAICLNASTTLGAASVTGSTYSWTSVPAGFISTLSNPLVTPLVTTTYTVVESVTATGCTNTHGVLVTVNPLPAAVAGVDRAICLNASTTLGAASVTGSTYSWTSVPAGFISTLSNPLVTPLVTTTYTVVESVTATGCTNTHGVLVTVNPLPVPTITGNITVCEGATGNIYTTETGMTNYIWTVPAGGTITSGGTSTSNSVTITWPVVGPQTVTVNYTNPSGCPGVTSGSINVTVNTSPVPTIGSNNVPCVNSYGNQYYTEAGMTNYLWSVSAGGTITSGQGTNAILVTWSIAGVQTVSVNYISPTGCPAANPTVYPLFVNPMPGAAGTISGLTSICAGTNGVAYSTGAIANATSYTWTVPTGAAITSGAGTNSIIVNFSTTAISGNVTVAGTNTCGDGTSFSLPVTVNPLPAPAETIVGTDNVCQGATGVNYTVPSIAGATSYIWTVPSGATITSGATTAHIVVSFSSTASSGVITVLGTNTCGNGAVSPNFNVTVNPIPETPAITVNGFALTSNAPAGNQWYYNGITIQGATDQTYTVTHNTGYYWVVVTLNGCSSEISNKELIEVVGTEELPLSASFIVYPVPNDGQFTASISYPVETTFSIIVYSQLGSKLYELHDIQTVGGKFDVQINLKSIPSGLYSVVFINSDHKVVRKVLVKK